jgi:Uma2 family endonuclease
MKYDTGRKAQFYASHGIALLWVIEAERLRIHCSAKSSADGYLESVLVESGETLDFACAPELSLKLADLPLI